MKDKVFSITLLVFLLSAGAGFVIPKAPSLETKAWIFLGCVLFPFLGLAFLRSQRPSPSFPATGFKDFPLPQGKGWILFLAAALALKTWTFFQAPPWPMGDEALSGISAIELARQWNWRFFYSYGQSPPLLNWMAGLLYKFRDSPGLSLWMPPSLVSLLTIMVGYLAARRFFPRTFSAVFSLLLAFSFWPLYLERLCLQGVTVPLWVSLVLWVFGLFRDAPKAKARKKWAFLLGLCLGLGSFTFASWPAFAFPFLLTVGFLEHKKPRVFAGSLRPALLAFGLALLPFLGAILTEGYGQHLRNAGIWGPTFEGRRQLLTFLGYFGILWPGLPYRSGAYLSHPLGFLHPLLAPFFFLGILEMVENRSKSWVASLAALIGLGFLPGILSLGVDSFRVVQLLPLVLVVVTLGIGSFWEASPARWRKILVPALILLALGLDFNRWAQSFRNLALHPERFEGLEMTYEKFQAFSILREAAKSLGLGLVFTELIPETGDQSLAFFTQPFNAAWNQKLPFDQARWMGILTQPHYIPALSARFPGVQWTVLGSVKGTGPGNHVLGVFPLDPGRAAALLPWKNFYSQWQEQNLKIINLPNGIPRSGLMAELAAFYPSVPPDPYLQSCYFERLLFNYSWEKTFHPEDASTRWENFSGVFQQAFSKSYQDVVLCEKYGRLYASEGQNNLARQLWEKALRQDPQNQFLQYEIKQLGSPAK